MWCLRRARSADGRRTVLVTEKVRTCRMVRLRERERPSRRKLGSEGAETRIIEVRGTHTRKPLHPSALAHEEVKRFSSSSQLLRSSTPPSLALEITESRALIGVRQSEWATREREEDDEGENPHGGTRRACARVHSRRCAARCENPREHNGPEWWTGISVAGAAR